MRIIRLNGLTHATVVKTLAWEHLDASKVVLCNAGHKMEEKMPTAAVARRRSFGPRYPDRYSSVLVIVPAYNEEGNIGHVVRKIKQHAGYADILVINDGSSDATAEIAQRNGASVLNLPYNLGIGGAVQAGIKFAWNYGYPFVVRVDGDRQHNVEDIPRLLGAVMQGRADVVIGSRFCEKKETYRPPFARRLGIRMFSLLVSVLVGYRVYDTTSGLQCMDLEAMKHFVRYYPQDYPEVEAHILMHKAGLKIIEIPVVMRPREAGVSSISLLRSLYYVFKVFLATLIAALGTEPPRRKEKGMEAKGALAYFTQKVKGLILRRTGHLFAGNGIFRRFVSQEDI
jgi:glycosyltransferase involved in cell wall biosynthesis